MRREESEVARTVMEINGEGRRRSEYDWGGYGELLVSAWRMWEIGPNEGLGRRWPTPNRWDKGEGDDIVDDVFQLKYSLYTFIL